MSYTEQEVAVLTEVYTGKDNKAELTTLAEKLGKSPASIRAKLSAMGVYVKQESVKKRNGVKKEDLAKTLAPMLELNEAEEEALTKTTIAVLEKILRKLSNTVAN